ncbi:MAG: hypothetical protein M1817_006912 [Caeruleum heppii]|nr:MAG: hypothetical protein M1817_006912 [Caeruleum heppii]
MSIGRAGDFARVLPSNQVARRLFSQCYISCLKDDPFHLNFMIPLAEQSAATEEPVESSTEYDSYHSTGADVGNALQWGYFVLSLEDSRLPEIPPLGWRFGRGASKLPNRGVDMLLAKPGDIWGKSLASNHFSLRLSNQSGLLMLSCGNAKKLELETHINGNWEPLAPGQEQLIFQHSTMLRAGRCEFELQYTIDKDGRKAFLEQRSLFIDHWLKPQTDVYDSFTYVPGDDITIRGRYLQLRTQGHGTFGWVSQGVDTQSGHLIAIKEIRLESRRSWPAIKDELDIGRRVQDKKGLLPLIDSACEHGYPDACSVPEKYYLYFPFAIKDLSAPFWSDESISHNDRLQLLEQPLQGLSVLHDMGIMHRDIRRQNILQLSLRPPRTALCDYGKAIEAVCSKQTTIGPVHTLAPEVWTAKRQGPYGPSIDVWAYGYTIAEVLGYHGWADNPPIRPERHQAILAMLQNHMHKCPEDEDLVDLATRMLAWDPERRPTAAEALEHRCWAPVRNQITSHARPEDDLIVAQEGTLKRRRMIPFDSVSSNN